MHATRMYCARIRTPFARNAWTVQIGVHNGWRECHQKIERATLFNIVRFGWCERRRRFCAQRDNVGSISWRMGMISAHIVRECTAKMCNYWQGKFALLAIYIQFDGSGCVSVYVYWNTQLYNRINQYDNTTICLQWNEYYLYYYKLVNQTNMQAQFSD